MLRDYLLRAMGPEKNLLRETWSVDSTVVHFLPFIRPTENVYLRCLQLIFHTFLCSHKVIAQRDNMQWKPNT